MITNNKTDYSSNNYIPSLSVTKNLMKDLDILVTFKTTVRLPSFTDLSSTKDYFDPTTYIIGNSDLKASYKNHFDFQLVYMQYASVGFSHTLTDNYISKYIGQTTENNKDFTYLSKINIDKLKKISTYCTLPFVVSDIIIPYHFLLIFV